MTFKQKIVSYVIVGGLFRISELIANIIKPLRNLFKSKKLHRIYVYFKCEQDFIDPVAEKICYCLGLKREWKAYQESIEKLHKLIFGEEN